MTYEIGKFLCKECKLNLNEVLPIRYKIISRLDSESHHKKILCEKFRSLFTKYEHLPETQYRYNVLLKIVQELSNPFNFLLLKNEKFKNQVIIKLLEFLDGPRVRCVSEKWFSMFKRQCKKSLDRVLKINIM